MTTAMQGRSTGSSISRWLYIAVLSALLQAGITWSQAQPSPYSGQHKRPLKALSQDETASYLDGDGMGFSKAAELNRYPGPLHVLEMADELGLSPTQIKETHALLDSVKREARELGQQLIREERELDSLFASGRAAPQTSDALVAKIADLRGKIRASHLRAHIAQRTILTAKQVQHYDKVRGYAEAIPESHQHVH